LHLWVLGEKAMIREHRQRRGRRKKYKINKLRLSLSAIIFILIIMVGVSIKNVISLRIEQSQLKNQNIELKQQKAKLKEEFESVNDLNYIEEQARIQLKLIKPGETLYILNDEKGDSSGNDTNGE